MYSSKALASGPLAVLGLDVAPSTLLPSYDPDTGLVLLTGKVCSAAGLYRSGWRAGERGLGEGSFSWPPHSPPIRPLQGDTRVFLYELLPEAPFFLECNSFTSSDPHKVSLFTRSSPSLGGTTGLPRPLVAIWGNAGACRVSGSLGWVCPAAPWSWLFNSTIIRSQIM